MALKNRINGLDIKFTRNIHDSIVFVIKLTVVFRTLTIALNKVMIEFHVRTHMAVKVHRHKSAEL